jgi:hypothetical protein
MFSLALLLFINSSIATVPWWLWVLWALKLFWGIAVDVIELEKDN